MAAITPINLAVKNLNGQRAVNVRTATLQATTGQTDWIWLPAWVKTMRVYLNVSALAGTTPKCSLQILTSDPKLLDDATGGQLNLGSAAITSTGFTAAGNFVVVAGPGVTGIADSLVQAASGNSGAKINSVLPQLIGLQVINFRGSADETYSYTLNVEFGD